MVQIIIWIITSKVHRELKNVIMYLTCSGNLFGLGSRKFEGHKGEEFIEKYIQLQIGLLLLIVHDCYLVGYEYIFCFFILIVHCDIVIVALLRNITLSTIEVT